MLRMQGDNYHSELDHPNPEAELIYFKGQRCPSRSCQCRLHDICTQRFFSTQKARKCPLCKTDWTGNDHVGERAAMNKKEKPKRISTNGNAVRRRSALIMNEDEEQEQEEDGDDYE